MPTLVEKRNLAGDKYRAAVIELRDSYVDLAALDRLANAPGFGPPPAVIPLRHSTYLPDLGGCFTDGITEAIALHSASVSTGE